jgi:mersacidin/lichenicidin family type 2 lantibiotic
MSKLDIIRAWKDEEYRNSLTETQRALLPAHPAGLIELDQEEMRGVLGAGTISGPGLIIYPSNWCVRPILTMNC